MRPISIERKVQAFCADEDDGIEAKIECLPYSSAGVDACVEQKIAPLHVTRLGLELAALLQGP